MGRRNFATPIPFVLMSPGMVVGSLVPGSGYDIDGDFSTPSALSICVFYGIDTAMYSGIAYLSSWLVHRRHQTSPPTSAELR
jgi:hypothetical protein